MERPEITDMLISSGNSDDTVRQRKTKLQKEAEKQEKEAEKEKKKEAKKDTKLVSYEMFRQGMNIDEIAKARDLVSGTNCRTSGALCPFGKDQSGAGGES